MLERPQYKSPLKQNTQIVTNSSYQEINFNDVAYLLWQTQTILDATVQWYVGSETVLNGYVEDGIVYLPPIGKATVGLTFTLQNVSAYDILVKADDGSSVITLPPASNIVKFTVKSTDVTLAESTCWKTYVTGTVTNTSTLAQNLGASLRYIASTNNVQAASTVNTVSALTYNIQGGYYEFSEQNIIDLSNTVIVNPAGTNQQVNIILPSSQVAYADVGFSVTFVNEGTVPVVLMTEGDTINGLAIQSTNNTASYIVAPGSSTTLSSSSNPDWVITDASSLFQNVFKTANIDLSTVNYVYLAKGGVYSNSVTSIVPQARGVGVAIDMSANMDLAYSPIWYLTGNIPQTIQEFMAARGQTTVWILLPNNLSYVYFIQGRSSPQFKVGLGCRFSETQVALAPIYYSYPMGSSVTIPMQYSAQITPNAPQVTTQFTATSLLGSSGSGSSSNYPDITDANGLVSIIGQYGLTSLFGPITAPSMFIGTQAVMTALPNPRLNDILISNANGQAVSSNTQISIDPTMGGRNPSNQLLSTQAATVAYISRILNSGITIQGAYDAANNIPPLQQGVGTAGYGFFVTTGGTQQLLDPVVYPPNGSYTFVPGDMIYFGANGQWSVIPFNNSVIRVNGLAGIVTLGLGNLSGVNIASPADKQVLSYDQTLGLWVNQYASVPGLTADGSSITFTLPTSFNNATSFNAQALFSSGVTFGIAGQSNVPTYVGEYPTNPTGNELVTISLLNQTQLFPDISDVNGTVFIEGEGGLDVANGPITLSPTATQAMQIELSDAGNPLLAATYKDSWLGLLNTATANTVNAISLTLSKDSSSYGLTIANSGVSILNVLGLLITGSLTSTITDGGLFVFGLASGSDATNGATITLTGNSNSGKNGGSLFIGEKTGPCVSYDVDITRGNNSVASLEDTLVQASYVSSGTTKYTIVTQPTKEGNQVVTISGTITGITDSLGQAVSIIDLSTIPLVALNSGYGVAIYTLGALAVKGGKCSIGEGTSELNVTGIIQGGAGIQLPMNFSITFIAE